MKTKKYRLFWTIDKKNLTMKAAVEVETKGWVGLGISANGMEGADILLGWVKDGQVYFADRFAEAKAKPPVDVKQDYYDITGGEYSETAPSSSNESWMTRRAAIAGFATGVGALALILVIGRYAYKRCKKREEKTEYYEIDDERNTKEAVILDDHNN